MYYFKENTGNSTYVKSWRRRGIIFQGKKKSVLFHVYPLNFVYAVHTHYVRHFLIKWSLSQNTKSTKSILYLRSKHTKYKFLPKLNPLKLTKYQQVIRTRQHFKTLFPSNSHLRGQWRLSKSSTWTCDFASYCIVVVSRSTSID